MTLAEQIREYIKCRAEVENVEFDLSLDLFQFCVMVGADVFGVVHDGERMLYDVQEPYDGFFVETVGRITGRCIACGEPCRL